MHDSIIIGGGLAGLQAAIQLGRYQHDVLVIDADEGRSNLCQCYHNIIGWPEGVSGEKLREIGKEQAEVLGVKFLQAKAASADKNSHGFTIKTDSGETYETKTLLISTGVTDRNPLPELEKHMGLSVFVCPDCDGYEIRDRRSLILGSGTAGAGMALTLSHWSDDLIFINHDEDSMPEKTQNKLDEKNIQVKHSPIKEVLENDNEFAGVRLENGETVSADRAFIAFKGNQVHSELAEDLDIECHENGHIFTEGRTNMTNVENVWAAGDVAVHSEQAVIAMGDGLQAAIWMHKKIIE